ncbi:NADPH-dependent oxidoreductase [Metabacillus fastidiosus]|uniref:NADPH-dependent oxidoreductase n=1 Tax=Metabacillus fastidiosus TaxID=1458 RepID=UPI002E2473FF|nr:NADPH-dependent oxidoreductase [Metabacillus fastidiosus]
MNDCIKTLMSHRSYRKYIEKEVDDKDLNIILSAAQAAPSWIHGQQVSIITVKDKTRKTKLAELCGNQEHIKQAPVFLLFCADFYRAKLASELEGNSFEIIDDIDSVIVGATDVGIALANAITAAESLGLNIVPIGGIRRNPLEVITLLELPKYVIPISGLCIGYGTEDPGLNPRLPKEAVIHNEQYNHEQMSYLKQYNETYREDQLKKGNKEVTWTKRISEFYRASHYNNQYADVPEMLRQQGFLCKDVKKDGAV